MDISFQYGFFDSIIQTGMLFIFLKILGAFVLAIFAGAVAGRVLKKAQSSTHKTATKIDDLFFEAKINQSLQFLFSVFVFGLFLSIFSVNIAWVQKGVQLAVIFGIVRLIWKSLNWGDAVYRQNERLKKLPIKGVIELAKLIFGMIALVLAISLLLEKSLWVMLSGIGALSAIILLIFKDTITNFVSGIQIIAGRIIQIGDWISVPDKNIDGEVTDISLYFIKIQNWDKTISVVQLSQIINASIQNWRGMYEAKSRRIQRSIQINANQVRFIDRELMERLKKIRLLEDFLADHKESMERFIEINPDTDHFANHRTYTNIGLFRMYILYYLRNSSDINSDLTLMVRQLEARSQGIPLQIYAFANTIEWIQYEKIQSDIFDHLFAVCRYFDLEIFQIPTGNDFQIWNAKERSSKN